jgi:hypothetical protein
LMSHILILVVILTVSHLIGFYVCFVHFCRRAFVVWLHKHLAGKSRVKFLVYFLCLS